MARRFEFFVEFLEGVGGIFGIGRVQIEQHIEGVEQCAGLVARA